MQVPPISLPSRPAWSPASTAAMEGLETPEAGPGPQVIIRGRDGLDHPGTEITFEQNQTIYFECDPAEHCYHVIAGVVRICKETEDGRRQIAAFPTRGDLFGWSGGRHYAYSAEAATDVVLLRWPRAVIEAAIANERETGHRVLALLFQQLADTQNHLMLLGRMHARERVASFLLHRADHHERNGMGSDRIPFRFCRRDMADHLGLTTETVSRVMSAMKRRGLIDFVCGESVQIRDRQALERTAEGLPG